MIDRRGEEVERGPYGNDIEAQAGEGGMADGSEEDRREEIRREEGVEADCGRACPVGRQGGGGSGRRAIGVAEVVVPQPRRLTSDRDVPCRRTSSFNLQQDRAHAR